MSDKNKPDRTEERRPCEAWNYVRGMFVADIGPVHAEVFQGSPLLQGMHKWIGVVRHSGHAYATEYDSAVAAQLAAEDAAAEIARDILRALGRV